MNISLDYDETYTRDPKTWDQVIALLRGAGHTVYCVTMRYDNVYEKTQVGADLNGKVDAIFFTSREAKQNYMSRQGIWIDVWIDDMPIWITTSAKG